ncbi:Pol polyprotein [Elysia marginata]|uniref:Pol polyprotein n=1 Tax=Elysia marginata TaxID=1093978 RepID=A0AAV4EBX3_9GAST|nr:Pol polyprotein [Elysia marginata]
MFSPSQPIHKDLQINGVNIRFQVDTGASLSVMNRDTFSRAINAPLEPLSKVLKTYTGEAIKICWKAIVDVHVDKPTFTLPLVDVEKGGPPFLGRDWLSALGISLCLNTNRVCTQTSEQVLESHGSVFKSLAGCLRGTKIKLYTEPGAIPKFCRARKLLYALRKAIEEELSRLQRDGIIKPIEHSEWATPIVPVWKKNGTVSIYVMTTRPH